MATPLRKDRPEEEQLTTADLAKGQSAAQEAKGPKPVATERNTTPQRSKDRVHLAAKEYPEGATKASGGRSGAVGGVGIWRNIQTSFVDEPRRAVEQADGLVASAMKKLAEVFAQERSTLEHQWDRGDSVSTEDLRVALQRYRTFFHRLLSV